MSQLKRLSLHSPPVSPSEGIEAYRGRPLKMNVRGALACGKRKSFRYKAPKLCRTVKANDQHFELCLQVYWQFATVLSTAWIFPITHLRQQLFLFIFYFFK